MSIKNGSPKGGRFAEGERNRQMILDYVHLHPGSTATEIRTALGFLDTTCSTILKKMTHNYGDLTREPFKFKDASNVNISTFRYYALREVTIPAQEVAGRLAKNLRPAPAVDSKKHSTRGKWVNGRYVNICDEDKAPIKNQGGQGACRRQFGIQSSFSII